MKTDDETLISALEILSRDIQNQDGIANAVIAEAAVRLGELVRALRMVKTIEEYAHGDTAENVMTWQLAHRVLNHEWDDSQK